MIYMKLVTNQPTAYQLSACSFWQIYLKHLRNPYTVSDKTIYSLGQIHIRLLAYPQEASDPKKNLKKLLTASSLYIRSYWQIHCQLLTNSFAVSDIFIWSSYKSLISFWYINIQFLTSPLNVGGALAGVIGYFSDLSFRHATTQT